ncbi:MAG TPA: rRNA adenine dimethyltransferase family protein [Nitrososphaeraceae archaeon]|jgi:16S rRNA (adenine1518-N6/adenine1519-N6)-dimethyltransferase
MTTSRRKKYGQHILKQDSVIERIIDSAKLFGIESVCEIGTGTGTLTREICKRAKWVTSFEIDKQFFENAKKYLGHISNLALVNEDPLKSPRLDFDVFISNIPYSRSKAIMEWLAMQYFDRAIIMLQKEFADKIQSQIGERGYRAISVVCQYSFHIRNLFAVSKKAFYPVPLVESSVLQLVPKYTTRLTAPIIRNLNAIFSQKHHKASVLKEKFLVNNEVRSVRIDHLDFDQLVHIAQSAVK